MSTAFSIIYSIRRKVTRETIFDLSINNLRIIPLIIISTLGLVFGIASPLSSLIPMSDFFKEIFRSIVGQTGVFNFAMIVIAAPIFEELIFRGVMLEGLLKKYSPARSIVISSFLFGLIHLNPWQFISAFVLGIFSGWVYYRTRSLMPSIIIHAAANLTSFISGFYIDVDVAMDQTLVEFYGGWVNLTAIVMISIIATALSVFLLQREFRRPINTQNWKPTRSGE